MKEYEIQKKNEIGNWVYYSTTRYQKDAKEKLKMFKSYYRDEKFRLVCIETKVIAR